MGHPTDDCYTGIKKMRGSMICFWSQVRSRLGSRRSAGGEQGSTGSLVSIQNSGGRKLGSVKLTGHSVILSLNLWPTQIERVGRPLYIQIAQLPSLLPMMSSLCHQITSLHWPHSSNHSFGRGWHLIPISVGYW